MFLRQLRLSVHESLHLVAYWSDGACSDLGILFLARLETLHTRTFRTHPGLTRDGSCTPWRPLAFPFRTASCAEPRWSARRDGKRRTQNNQKIPKSAAQNILRRAVSSVCFCEVYAHPCLERTIRGSLFRKSSAILAMYLNHIVSLLLTEKPRLNHISDIIFLAFQWA